MKAFGSELWTEWLCYMYVLLKVSSSPVIYHSWLVFMLKITAAMVLNIMCSALFWYMLLSLSSTSLGLATASSFRCYYSSNPYSVYSYSYICNEYSGVSTAYYVCSCYSIVPLYVQQYYKLLKVYLIFFIVVISLK